MAESVRLVVWNLGPDQWDQAPTGADFTPLSLVGTLARRGIVSAVCGPHANAVRSRLEQAEIASLVLFEDDAVAAEETTQGERIETLVRALRLPPGNVLLVSSDPSALLETPPLQPGLQVADGDIVGRLLDDPRLQGRDDPDLQHLALSRLLLRRQAAQRRDPSFGDGPDAPAFLRACGMRVRFDYDLASQVGVALDLIRGAPAFGPPRDRLPDQPAQAEAALADLIGQHATIGGLIRLRDRFGDWGIVGIYLTSHRALRQFAFSPQVAGLGVDDWVYDAIGRPPPRALKEVAARLARERAKVDWIEPDDSLQTGGTGQAAPWIPAVRARGGWDVEAVVHYLRPITGETLVEHTLTRETGLQVRRDHSSLLRLGLEPPAPEVLAAAAPLGFRAEDLSTDLFAKAPGAGGGAIVLSVAADAEALVYQHTTLGLTLPVVMPAIHPNDLTAVDPTTLPADQRERAGSALEHLRTHFACRGRLSGEETEANLAQIFARVPPGWTLFVLLPDARRPGSASPPVLRQPQQQLNESIRRAAVGRPGVVLVNLATISAETGMMSGAQAAGRNAAYHAVAALIARKLGQQRKLASHPAIAAQPDSPLPPAPAPEREPPPPKAPPARHRSFLARLFGR
jgi:hypothetical protein